MPQYPVNSKHLKLRYLPLFHMEILEKEKIRLCCGSAKDVKYLINHLTCLSQFNSCYLPIVLEVNLGSALHSLSGFAIHPLNTLSQVKFYPFKLT